MSIQTSMATSQIRPFTAVRDEPDHTILCRVAQQVSTNDGTDCASANIRVTGDDTCTADGKFCKCFRSIKRSNTEREGFILTKIQILYRNNIDYSAQFVGRNVHFQLSEGNAVAQLVDALRYKPKSRGFDSRWCHWNFSLI